METPVTLLVPEKADVELEQVFAASEAGKVSIRRLGKFWIKDESLASRRIAIYGNQAFAFVVAQIYGVELLSADDALIARLDRKWVKRNIRLATLSDMKGSDFPVFVKPVIPKIFAAGIFNTIIDFEAIIKGLPGSEAVLVAEVVGDIKAEARAFVLNGQIKDMALYEGNADMAEAAIFLQEFLKDGSCQLPASVVVDVAYSNRMGWFILEFNSCWGAGLNNCKAENVIDCIIAATLNR